jgi:hypothetical protein
MTRKLVSLVAAFGLAVGMLVGLTSNTSASHGLPHTYLGCVLAGGTVTVSGPLGLTSTCTLTVDGQTVVFQEAGNSGNVDFTIEADTQTTVDTQVLRPDLTTETTTYETTKCINPGGQQVGGPKGKGNALANNPNCQVASK